MVFSAFRSVLLLAVVLAAIPIVAGDIWAYQVSLYLTYGVVATGLGLAWGMTGSLSLGHGLYMALSAYLAGNVFMALDGSLLTWPAAVLCAILPMLVAFVASLAVFRGQTGSTTSFPMVTLALALAGGQLAIGWQSVTGGFNGLLGVPPLPFTDGIIPQYFLVAIVAVVICAVYAWITAAPLGTVWRAISVDERRLQFLGYDTALHKALAFSISGLFAGVGGVVYAQQQGIVTPDLTGFAFCGSLLLFVAVGGRFHILGPIIGALFVGLLSAELRDTVQWWELVLAVVFILVVLKFPTGIAGISKGGSAFQQKSGTISPPAAPVVAKPVSFEMKNVSVRLGSVQILDELDFRAEDGKTTCIIGPNGAGKSSSFNALTGMLPLTGGTINLDDRELSKRTPVSLARAGVSRKFQAPTIFASLTIRENLALGLWTKRKTKFALWGMAPWHWHSDLLTELQTRFPFLEDQDRPASDLSHGERQVLELLMVLLTEPRVLLLDEPCAGLSKDETAAVVELLKWVRVKRGMTIVIVEHDMSLVQSLADTVNVFHQGKFLAKGTIEEIRANNAVQNVYAGGQR
ncbi:MULTISPECIES: branched-chain amino acid ABC transporter ATP-binding protein/permease [Agrobacterium tumefaciens complex]|uniref:branched-chain amino acid ABC transporter ATP-binding protein/permease n=1 Tax=Agrobacterium tumefaciens TaxID=358 RepID=UPI000FE291A4|nr:ATP-binding cassette domain-containing protein [Agrobacterium tumefaciens]QAA98381.1 ABC transporter ATP-binding protein [Agrobacterium tumefaciens]QAB01094.1 ABC transporter ATP-binding protein [Agrobacterium tumefaciens]